MRNQQFYVSGKRPIVNTLRCGRIGFTAFKLQIPVARLLRKLFQIQIQIQNIFIEHITWVYIEIQEYETQMGLFNSIIITCHIFIFDLYFALGRNKLG